MRNKTFWRSVYLSAVLLLCLILGTAGVGRAYEKTKEIGFGEYKKAVEYDGETIRLLDFEIG